MYANSCIGSHCILIGTSFVKEMTAWRCISIAAMQLVLETLVYVWSILCLKYHGNCSDDFHVKGQILYNPQSSSMHMIWKYYKKNIVIN